MKYLKRYKIYESESYHEDDINVEFTSTVIDILQDFIDDGLNIQCFTVGYLTLKRTGATYTDNNIALFIMANHEDDITYKTLDFKSLKPYLKRVCDYMKSEGRHYVVNLQYRIKSKVKGKFGSMEQTGDITNIDYIDENINYESIDVKFKL
jgi:hypothetical protein